jgi:hypothetical protein
MLMVMAGVLSYSQDGFSQALPCPALDSQGNRRSLGPLDSNDRVIKILPVEQPGDRDVDAAIAEQAIDVIGFFESGGGSPWGTVSDRDTISIGFMQWNWGTQSLIDTFFRNTDRQYLDLAPVELRSDLSRLKDFSDTKTSQNKQRASSVIMSWTRKAPNDPVEMGVRRGVRRNLNVWLSTPAMKTVQLQLMNKVLGQAFFYARAWRRDTNNHEPINARLVTYFFDLLTFNGGTAGLWVQHVQHYRSHYQTSRATLESVASWLSSCQNFFSPTTKQKRLYALKDAVRTANYWHQQAASTDTAYDEDRVDLLVLGLLRAQWSTGDDYPKGFRGIYQADVLTRRGVIAIGGYARGSNVVLEWFQP